MNFMQKRATMITVFYCIVENSYAELCKSASPRYVLQQQHPETNTFAPTNNVSTVCNYVPNCKIIVHLTCRW